MLLAIQPLLPSVAEPEERASWLPMIVIALGQALLSFAISAIPVSMSGMVESFQTPPTTVGTAIVLYSLGVSGFILLGAKLGQRLGSKAFFQVSVALLGSAMLLLALSPTVEVMLTALTLAGLAAAGLVPALVVLVASHYHGKQQTEALGWLGSAAAIAGVLAFLIGGVVATLFSWRVTFGLLIGLAAVILVLSVHLRRSEPQSEVAVDLLGVTLSSSAIILLTFGFNYLREWGTLLARSAAPFDVLGVSPALLMIVLGIVLGMAFFTWTQRRAVVGKTQMLSLQVVSSPREWAAVVVLFIIGTTEAAINFSVPLYIQIVQGRSSMATAVALLPLLLAVVFTAVLVVRLYDRYSPRTIAQSAFVLVTAGTAWLAFVVRNDWSTLPVVVGLVIIGLGQGALVTLLFNVLVSASPKELAGDVGSLRGVAQNLAAAVGTSLIAALLVVLLTSTILRQLSDNPIITAELRDEVNLYNLNYFSDEQIKAGLAHTSATPLELDEALRINAEARTRALKIGFLVLSGLALLAIFPCRWLPDYRPDEVPPTTTGSTAHNKGDPLE